MSRARRRLLGVVAALLSAGALSAPALPASGQEVAPAPVFTVTPPTGLVDGQVVTIDGTGLVGTNTRSVYLCPADPDAECQRYAYGIEVGPGGTFHAEIRIRALIRHRYDVVADCRIEVCRLHEDPVRPSLDQAVSFDPAAPLLPDPVVTVTPDSDLIDGQEVTAEGRGFLPNEVVRVVDCDPTIDFSGCWGELVEADDDGSFSVPVEVDTFILHWRGIGDCRLACSVNVLDEANDHVRASAPLRMRPEGDEVVTVAPMTGLSDGDVVTVHATGLNPSYDAWVAQCWAESPQHGRWASCERAELQSVPIDRSGELTTTVVVHRTIRAEAPDGAHTDVDCAVDPRCTISVGGDAVRMSVPDVGGAQSNDTWVDTPIRFAPEAGPATPSAVTPAFTG